MDEAKREEIKKFAVENKITNAKVLEHYYIFGTLDLNSNVQEEGAPRSEHYMIDEFQSILNEIENPPVEE